MYEKEIAEFRSFGHIQSDTPEIRSRIKKLFDKLPEVNAKDSQKGRRITSVIIKEYGEHISGTILSINWHSDKKVFKFYYDTFDRLKNEYHQDDQHPSYRRDSFNRSFSRKAVPFLHYDKYDWR